MRQAEIGVVLAYVQYAGVGRIADRNVVRCLAQCRTGQLVEGVCVLCEISVLADVERVAIGGEAVAGCVVSRKVGDRGTGVGALDNDDGLARLEIGVRRHDNLDDGLIGIGAARTGGGRDCGAGLRTCPARVVRAEGVRVDVGSRPETEDHHRHADENARQLHVLPESDGLSSEQVHLVPLCRAGFVLSGFRSRPQCDRV